MVNLELSLDDVTLIMSALAAMPYKEVAAIIHQIDKSVRAQIEADHPGRLAHDNP